jgi:RHS repeat-associated protein
MVMTRSAACLSNVHFAPSRSTGKERDTESGNDYFGARYYASSAGRFMSPDWSASPASVPYASLPYPQSLNLYSYVQNNPLSRADADGHCDLCQRVKNFFEFKGAKTDKELEASKATVTSSFTISLPDPSRMSPAQLAIFSLTGAAMATSEITSPEANSEITSELTGEAVPTTEVEILGPAEGAGTARTMANGVPQPGPAGETIVGPNGRL